jgi:hypothetical protein
MVTRKAGITTMSERKTVKTNNQEQEAGGYQCKRVSIDKNRSFKTRNSNHHNSKRSNPTVKTKRHLPHSSHLIDNPPQATPS